MKPRGFTLIEMVAVVAIVGVLASAAVPLAELGVRRAHELELRRNLRTLREALDAHKRAADAGLIKQPADASGYPASLEVLVQGVEAQNAANTGASSAASAPMGVEVSQRRVVYFLRRLPRDPMADAQLPAAQTWGLRSYDSPPDAPRPGRDVFDVHSLSRQRAIDGTLYADW